jgi:hypothetical protein
MSTIADIEHKITGVYAIPPTGFYVGKIEVPCEPGHIPAVIDYTPDGPVLDTAYQREEHALAIEQHAGVDLLNMSNEAFRAYWRRYAHCLAIKETPNDTQRRREQLGLPTPTQPASDARSALTRE